MCVAVEQGKVDAKGIHEAAAELWSDFASNKKRAEIMGDLVVSTDPGDKVNKSGKASNVRASELRQIMTAASKTRGNVGFSDTLTEARAVIVRAKRAGDYKGNTQDAFVSIARAQLKVEDRPLTDEEIYAAVCPAPKAKDRTEAAELEKIAKALDRSSRVARATRLRRRRKRSRARKRAPRCSPSRIALQCSRCGPRSNPWR
jgi:hypothetical protein